MSIVNVSVYAKRFHKKLEGKGNHYNKLEITLTYASGKVETVKIDKFHGYGTFYLERVIEFLNKEKGYDIKYLTDLKKQSFTFSEEVVDVDNEIDFSV